MSAAHAVHLGEVGSTNDEALARLAAGGGAVWVVAERQTGGRGRRGRPWHSPPGNLYASYAAALALGGPAFGFLPLAAAVALGNAIASLGPGPAYKWPNDLLIEGRKVAGILVEAHSAGSVRRTVVGFGVNVAVAPDGAARLADHTEATAGDLFAALLPAFDTTLAILAAADGVARLREAWLSRAAGLGEPITVRTGRETRHGTFLGLDAAGRLLLGEPDGVRPVAAGDVFAQASELI